MRKFRFITSIVSIIALVNCIIGANHNLPKYKLGNQEYYIYEVSGKENIYSVCNKFNISKSDLVKINPKAAEGLKKGDKIYIPTKNESNHTGNIINESEASKTIHKVNDDETLYAISKQYNTTPEEIVKANPKATAGVKKGEFIVIPSAIAPQQNSQSSNIKVDSIRSYTIQEGETLTDLVKDNDTSLESLFSLNPAISPDEYSTGKVIKIKSGDNDTDIDDNAIVSTKFISYTANKGDNFASIADKFGTSIQALHQANPEVKAVKNNMVIYVPVCTDEIKISTSGGMPEDAYEIYDSIQTILKQNGSEIALLLPLQLNDSVISRQSDLYLEFYRGFLLALDSKKDLLPAPLTITLFDTDNSTSNVSDIILSDTLKNANFIIAPNNDTQLAMLADYGKRINATVVNAFIVKNDLYKQNEKVLQINIPHETMMNKVNDYLSEINDSYDDVIFLSTGDLPEKEVIPTLKNYFSNIKSSNQIHIIDMDNFPTDELNSLMVDDKSYLIVPTNATKSMIARIKYGLTELKDLRPNVNISLFGYPEWITYLNDYSEFFKAFNTTIYSRFFVDNDSFEYRDFSDKYKSDFKSELSNTIPQMGILGYDLGNHIINNLISDDSHITDGIQNIINPVETSNYKGFLNNAIYIIKFEPTGITRLVR